MSNYDINVHPRGVPLETSGTLAVRTERHQGGISVLQNPGEPVCLMSKGARFGLVNSPDFVLFDRFSIQIKGIFQIHHQG